MTGLWALTAVQWIYEHFDWNRGKHVSGGQNSLSSFEQLAFGREAFLHSSFRESTRLIFSEHSFFVDLHEEFWSQRHLRELKFVYYRSSHCYPHVLWSDPDQCLHAWSFHRVLRTIRSFRSPSLLFASSSFHFELDHVVSRFRFRRPPILVRSRAVCCGFVSQSSCVRGSCLSFEDGCERCYLVLQFSKCLNYIARGQFGIFTSPDGARLFQSKWYYRHVMNSFSLRAEFRDRVNYLRRNRVFDVMYLQGPVPSKPVAPIIEVQSPAAIDPPWIVRLCDSQVAQFFARRAVQHVDPRTAEQLAVLLLKITRASSAMDMAILAADWFYYVVPSGSLSEYMPNVLLTLERMYSSLFKGVHRTQGPATDLWDVLIHSAEWRRTSIYRLVSHLLTFITLGPVFHILNHKFMPELVQVCVKHSFSDKRDRDQFFMETFSMISDSLRGVQRFVSTGDVTCLYGQPDSLTTFLLEAEDTIHRVEIGEYDRTRGEDYFTSGIASVGSCLSKAKTFRKMAEGRKDFAAAQLFRIILKLENTLRNFEAERSARGSRIPAYVIGLIGDSGIGKTNIILPRLLQVLLESLKMKYTPELIYFANPGDNYMEGLHRHTVAVVYDDPVVCDAQLKQGNPFSFIHAAAGGSALHPPMAFEDKGMTVDVPIVVVLSNEMDFGARRSYFQPILLKRRVHRWFVKYTGPPALRKSVGVDIAKADLSDPMIFSFHQVGDSSQMRRDGMTVSVDKIDDKGYSLKEFLEVVRADFLECRITGREFQKMADSNNSPFCEICGIHADLHEGRVRCSGPLLESQAISFPSYAWWPWLFVFPVIFFQGLWAFVSFVLLCLLLAFTGAWRPFAATLPVSLLEFMLRVRLSAMICVDALFGDGYSVEQRANFISVYTRPLERFQSYAKMRSLLQSPYLRAFLGGAATVLAVRGCASLFRSAVLDSQSDPPEKKSPILSGPPSEPLVAQPTANVLVQTQDHPSSSNETALRVVASTHECLSPEAFHAALSKAVSQFAIEYRADDGELETMHVWGFNPVGGLWVFPAHPFRGSRRYVFYLEVEAVLGFSLGGGREVHPGSIFFDLPNDHAWVFLSTPTRISLRKHLFSSRPAVPDSFEGEWGFPSVVGRGVYCLGTSRTERDPVYRKRHSGPGGSRSGDCGRLLLTTSSGIPFVVGILVAGTHMSGDLPSSVSAFSVVCDSDVVFAFRELSKNGDVLPRYPPPPKPFVFQALTEGLEMAALSQKSIFRKMPNFLRGEVVGTLSPNYTSRPKICMKQTPFAAELSGEVALSYTPASSATHSEFGYPFSWINAHLDEYRECCKASYSPEFADVAVDCVFAPLFAVKDGIRIPPLSLEQSFSGVPSSFINRLPSSTSRGNLRYKGPKSDYYWESPNEEHQNAFVLTREANEAASLLQWHYENGFSFPVLIHWMPKMNEVLTIPKSKTRVARCINNLSMFVNAAMRQTFAPLFDWLRLHRLVWGSAIGINAMSSEWTQLHHEMCCFGGLHCIPFDVRKADKRNLIENRWRCVWRKLIALGVKLGLGSAWEARAKWLVSSLLHFYGVYNGDVVSVEGTVPSGQFGTTEENTLMTIFYTFYVLAVLSGVLPSDAINMIRVFGYGDDGIVAVHPSISHIFHWESLHSILFSAGVEITYGVEKGGVGGFISADELVFLKRGFAPMTTHVGAVVLSPLEESSILKMLAWYEPSKSISQSEQFSLCLEAALREFVFHGPKVYDVWRERIVAVGVKFGLRPLVSYSWDEWMVLYIQGEVRFWSEKE